MIARAARLLAAGLALAAPAALGQSLESVLSPGPVVEAHAKAEADCRKCHIPFDRAAQDGLCAACHKEVGRDLRARTGFHGRVDPPQPCRACHTDHRGRGAKIVQLDERAFDHAHTDFPLRGKHAAGPECRSCHVAGRKFREAPGRCVDCHRKEDVHKGRFGTACADCHGEADWKAVRFDHGRTRFPLRGRHAPLRCESCHKAGRFDNAPRTCIGCHRKDDRHKGTLGVECGDCHGERDWKVAGFDHRKTRFPLRGRHVTAECMSCHKSAVFKDAPTACVACHRKDDRHKGALGENCGACHTERSWKDSSFDHAKTDFPLLGSHAQVRCESCHRTPDYKRTPRDCLGCHRKDDVHEGQLGAKCESCHDEKTWKRARFDHGRTRFALIGSHLVVPCAKCHLTQRYRDAKRECLACHERDDVHKRRLGTACQSCHNARSWKAWDFNHDRQTRFVLDGAHRKAGCYACHRLPVDGRATLPATCISCHAAEDVHDGSYGRQCEKCHVTSSFRQIRRLH